MFASTRQQLKPHSRPLISLLVALAFNLLLQVDAVESAFNKTFESNEAISESQLMTLVCGTQQQFDLQAVQHLISAAITTGTTLLTSKSKSSGYAVLAQTRFSRNSFSTNSFEVVSATLYQSRYIYRYSGLAPPVA